MRFALQDVRWDERGLAPAVVQDARTGEVLTLAYMNAESLTKTLETGETWLWSRTRNALWHKGETSGNTQRVRAVRVDCDGDALLVSVEPAGPACHTGARTCFHQELQGESSGEASDEIDADGGAVLRSLYALVESRRGERPEGSYTTYLFERGLDKILKKVGEEASETIIAAKNEDRAALVSELSDLVYHLVVLMVERGVRLEQVFAELSARGAGRKGGGA
jgi:phosphoribosyl-ATP pyrophosphohydrolase/phosphoribosyl-AMP cyclohydrolase